jgi:cysteine desulfurase
MSESDFLFYIREEFGNAGSRTHEFGNRAKQAVQRARDQVAAVVHVDAAQGFGKCIAELQNPRIDLISISGHMIYAPKGVGALVTRRRGYSRPPLTPLTFGGGQERGLRPGTLPVALIVAAGRAAELALGDVDKRNARCQKIREQAVEAFRRVGGVATGDQSRALPSTLNVAIPVLDSEAVMLALKDMVAISNGSACTSQSYTASHVLATMGLPDDHVKGALRLSWCHLTPEVDWNAVVRAIRKLQ